MRLFHGVVARLGLVPRIIRDKDGALVNPFREFECFLFTLDPLGAILRLGGAVVENNELLREFHGCDIVRLRQQRRCLCTLILLIGARRCLCTLLLLIGAILIGANFIGAILIGAEWQAVFLFNFGHDEGSTGGPFLLLYGQ